jgi:Cu+-exporting ATPase
MEEKVQDLVCGMEFEKDKASATFDYKGKTYYFCHPSCRDKFAQDPEKYIGPGKEE